MKLLNTKIISIVVLGILLPGASLHAWSLWPFGSTQAVVQKATAAPEMAKAAAKASVAGYVARGFRAASNVAQVGENILAGASSFAWNNPRVTTAAVITGCAYVKRREIADWCNKKIKEYQPYIKTAATIAGATGGIVAAKKLYDAYSAITTFKNNTPLLAQTTSLSSNPTQSVVKEDRPRIDHLKDAQAGVSHFENFPPAIAGRRVHLPMAGIIATPKASSGVASHPWINEFTADQWAQEYSKDDNVPNNVPAISSAKQEDKDMGSCTNDLDLLSEEAHEKVTSAEDISALQTHKVMEAAMNRIQNFKQQYRARL